MLNRPAQALRLRILCLVGLCTFGPAARCGAEEAPAPPIQTALTTYFPAPNGVYAAAATLSPYAAKLFVSGIAAPDANSAFAELTTTLKLAGATPADLVNVRGSLMPGDNHEVDMATWNEAWSALFTDVSHRPTRTTLGAVALPGDTNTTVVEGVAALPFDPGSLPPGRATLNAHVRSFGSGPFGSSAATWVAPGAPLIFTAGTLADVVDPKQPENAVPRYGDMATQTASVFQKLNATLALQGAGREDIFYVRALVSPPLGETGVDFAGFGRAFAAAFVEVHPARRPALTLWAAPGFNSSGRLVEIEAYAAAPNTTGPFALNASGTIPSNPRMTGADTSPISSSGAAPGYQSLTWFAGVIGTPGSMHDESVSALLVLRERVAASGAHLGRALMLRAYPVVGDEFREKFGEWNEAYSRFFNLTPLNPHKPARTAFPVATLPGQRQIEVEIVTVGP